MADPDDSRDRTFVGVSGNPVPADSSTFASGARTDTGTVDLPSEIEGEPEAAAEIFGDRIHLARRYVFSLASDGIVRGLIGPRESGRLWSRHLLNSAVVSALLPRNGRVVDIGSGAGLPGIPLAIVLPHCEFFLVEPLERRTVFLRQVVTDLGLTNCRVVRGRADQVVSECGNSDVVTSRAVAPLERLVTWSAPLLRFGGILLALKGSSAASEVARDRVAVTRSGLTDLEVLSVGSGLVEPETVVIRGRRVAVADRDANNGSSQNYGKRAPRASRPRK